MGEWHSIDAISRTLPYRRLGREPKKLEEFDFGFNTSIKKNKVFDLATCRLSASVGTCCGLALRNGKESSRQAIGLSAVRCGVTVYYRSIFDTVRDFLQDEAMEVQERILQRYLKPDLLSIDDMGMKQLPKRSGNTSRSSRVVTS